MPFTLRPCPRFPMQWAVTLQRGAIPQVADLLLGFRHAVNTPVSSGPAYADWMSLGASDSGTTVYADLATLHREGDLVKMLVLFDFKTKQTKADVSYLSAKAQMEYDCDEQRFAGHTVMYFSGNMGNGQLLDRSSGKGKRLRVSPGSLDHNLWKLAAARSDRAVNATSEGEASDLASVTKPARTVVTDFWTDY